MGSLTENKFPILLDYSTEPLVYVLPAHEFVSLKVFIDAFVIARAVTQDW